MCTLRGETPALHVADQSPRARGIQEHPECVQSGIQTSDAQSAVYTARGTHQVIIIPQFLATFFYLPIWPMCFSDFHGERM